MELLKEQSKKINKDFKYSQQKKENYNKIIFFLL